MFGTSGRLGHRLFRSCQDQSGQASRRRVAEDWSAPPSAGACGSLRQGQAHRRPEKGLEERNRTPGAADGCDPHRREAVPGCSLISKPDQRHRETIISLPIHSSDRAPSRGWRQRGAVHPEDIKETPIPDTHRQSGTLVAPHRPNPGKISVLGHETSVPLLPPRGTLASTLPLLAERRRATWQSFHDLHLVSIKLVLPVVHAAADADLRVLMAAAKGSGSERRQPSRLSLRRGGIRECPLPVQAP